VLGDWGGGFRLACNFLEFVAREYDYGRTISLAKELLEFAPSISDIEHLQVWFDSLCRARQHDWRFHLAGLAAVVTDAAERGDREAIRLVEESAAGLVETILLGIERSGRATVEELPIVCQGGQFVHSRVYREAVKGQLEQQGIPNEVILAKFSPVVGTALIAYAEGRMLPANEDTIRIARSVLDYPRAESGGLVIPHAPIPKLLERTGRVPDEMPDIIASAEAPRSRQAIRIRSSTNDQKEQRECDRVRGEATHAQHDVFLAHNSADKTQVEAVAHELRRRGLCPWLDKDEVPPGRWFQDVIQRAIHNVKSAAIFIGPSTLGRWEAVELRAFISQCVEREIPVIPVLLPGVAAIPSELLFLKELNFVSFGCQLDDREALDRLEWGITGTRPQHA